MSFRPKPIGSLRGYMTCGLNPKQHCTVRPSPTYVFPMTSSGIDENDGGFLVFFFFLRGGAIGLFVISSRVSVSLLYNSVVY